jgi:serine/threonine protein kinase/tetratricopeptide (TPR) repeat protein
VQAGDSIGPYSIIEPLGAGGMGQVYRARDTRLAREVALKQLSDPALENDVARRRVLREARAAAALSHPNIATIYDVLETPHGLIIVMEYVPGESLAARLRRGPLHIDEALQFAGQIAEALSDAHEHGVIHRDLKPANIQLAPGGKAKILDFGIARSAPDPANQSGFDDAPTEAGMVIGTPDYMAPEQLVGGRADQRSDVYGLGVVLFEMLTGHPPFPHADFLGNALAVFERGVPHVSHLAPHVPAEISAVVARAVARDPKDRFQTAAEFNSALDHAMEARGNARTVIAQPLVPWRTRHRPAAIAAVVLLSAIAAAIALWTQPWSSPVSAHSSVVGVLPFRNQSGDARNDPLVVGLSDAVAKRLASVRSLRVLPLDETREAFRATPDSATVARSLGAAFVVEGLLQRNGETLDVNLFLVAEDGRRRPAGRYSADVGRLFELHRRVVDGLTAALNQEGAIRGPSEPAPAPPTANQEAFADYAQARVFLERPDVPGNLDHAIRLFQSAIAKDNRFAQAYAGLGDAYWAQFRETNDPDWTVKARAANLDALRIDPAQPEVRMALAVMYQGLGRADEASEELRQVLALQPRSDNAHLVLARVHADRGEWDLAIAEAKAAIALRPNYWRNHAELGDTLMRAGRLENAAAAYRRLIELQPDSPRGYQRLGTVLQVAGRLDEALESYQKAASIRPSWGTYSNMGTLHYWRGDNKQAVDAYERAIALAPNQPELYANLGDALQRLGQSSRAAENYRRAIEQVQKLLAIRERDPLNLAALALYEAKLGRRAPAAASIRQAAALSPQDGEVLYVRAVVHALAGESRAACGALAEALVHGKSEVEVRHADELKVLKGCPAYESIIGPAK